MNIRIYTFEKDFRYIGVARDYATLQRKLLAAALLSNAIEVHGKDKDGKRVDGIWLSVESNKVLEMFS